MNVLIWIFLGVVVGWISSALIKTTQNVLMDIAFGVVGAAIGGGIEVELGQKTVTGFNLYSIIISVVGAMVLIAIVKGTQKIM